MSIKKELKKAYLKLTGQYTKIKCSNNIPQRSPYEIYVTNILSEDDFCKNAEFVQNMRKHKWTNPPKSFLCFLPYGSGSIFLAGGYRTIMAINNALSHRFNTKVYLCFFPITEGKNLEEDFQKSVQEHFPELKYEIVPYSQVWNLHVDVAMCNFWLGAYPLLKFNNCYEKYYLLQDHEALFYESGIVSTLAERTLHFGFYQFTNSMAIKKYIDFINGNNEAYRYFPGIDHKIYYPLQDKNFIKKTYKIIFYGRPSIARNCFYFLIEVLKNVKSTLKDKVEIISVGEDYDVNSYGLNDIIVNYGKFNNLQKLAELYRQCDIGVSLISTPTFSYQHLEYMASGLCLVTNKQDGIVDLLQDGVNAIVCEPTVNIMASRIINLVNSPKTVEEISKNGARFAQKLSWKDCFNGIADFILRDKTKN